MPPASNPSPQALTTILLIGGSRHSTEFQPWLNISITRLSFNTLPVNYGLRTTLMHFLFFVKYLIALWCLLQFHPVGNY